MKTRALAMLTSVLIVVGLSGCVLTGCTGGDAALEIKTADVMQAGTGEVREALREFKADLDAADDAREIMLIMSFVQLVKRDSDDDAAVAKYVEQFSKSLAKMRRFREASRERFQAAVDSLDTMDEVADGLQKFAIDSLTLQDEYRRYFTSWAEQIRTYREERAAQKQAEREATRAEREAFATELFNSLPALMAPAAGSAVPGAQAPAP
jgi:hypothetical protein